jgi:hydroxylamine reductase
MEQTMFCYQCEQTARGQGCTLLGVCGKDSDVAALQDLLVYQLEGLSYYADQLVRQGQAVSPETAFFVMDALFATLTNVSFDPARFFAFSREAQAIKDALQAQVDAARLENIPAAALYTVPVSDESIQAAAYRVNIRPNATADPDLQSLQDTLLYGLKGMAAYAHHAWVLGYQNDEVNAFIFKGLAALLDKSLALGDVLSLALELGQVNLKCMEVLDTANTTVYGNPTPTPVLITRKPGPFIVVSGHDLRDLALLLEQTAGKGINIYTHGEMLPAHGYPGLKKYPHLVGNYGGAWQNQRGEFDELPGAILMTTNCIVEPRDSYSDRIFTSGVVAWPGVAHIEERNGTKDFTPVIERALALGGWTAADAEYDKTVLVGFGHEAILGNAGAIVDAVKAGQIRHFFLIGGCDGAKSGRNYYTQFAETTPADTLMMTLACGKYRFNKGEYGTVAGFPRLLDVGQCNDAYSAIQVASALAGAFNCGVNDLPLTLVLSWFEQKAVCILLTLLSLGIKNIYLGPTLPAFITPNVLQVLVDNYNIHPISTPAADMAAMLA